MKHFGMFKNYTENNILLKYTNINFPTDQPITTTTDLY